MNKPIQAAVLSHHEESDCTGYPKKVGREKLSLITRIVSTVDDYCAMTEARGYNCPLSADAALVELNRECGLRYDNQILAALRDVIKEQKPHKQSKDL